MLTSFFLQGTVLIIYSALPDLADITGFIYIVTDPFMSGNVLCLLSLYVSLSLSKYIYFEVTFLCINLFAKKHL